MTGNARIKTGWLAWGIAFWLALAWTPKPVRADDTDDLLAGHSHHGYAFNEGPRQKANLMHGTGKVSFPVTTNSPVAQQFFNQGVGQLHGFWYFEAERSFRQVAAIDPDCAMAYWGMAMANLDARKRARGFIAGAVKRIDDVSDREAEYIDAVDSYLQLRPGETEPADDEGATASREEIRPQFNTGAEWEAERARRLAFIKSFEQILYDHPDDIEAKAFLAVQLWENQEWGLPITSHFAVDALLKQVLAVEPMHPCHHYRIHLWDLEKPEMALDSAAVCGQSAPAIAHMWHMPGHIYSRLKRYSDAAWHQEASARVDHAYMMRDRVLPDQIHNYAHNNEWLVRNLSHVGRVHDAIDLAKNMIELPMHPKYNTFTGRGSAYYGRRRLLEVLARYEMWDELIAMCHSSYIEPTDVAEQQAVRCYFLGLAYLRSGDVDKGANELLTLEIHLINRKESQSDAATAAEARANEEGKNRTQATQARLDAANKFDAEIDWLDEHVRELKGLVAVAEGDREAGIELLRKCKNADKTYLAEIELQSGKTEEAIKTARAYARKHANEAQPLARLVELLWAAGKKKQAEDAFQKLRNISAQFDLDVPPFARLKPIARELGFPEDYRLFVPRPDDFGQRPELESLGPFRWQPSAAPNWTLEDSRGKPHSLAEYRGRPVVIIFFLGSSCLHCAEQLQAFAPATDEYQQAGISLIAISSDDREGLKVSLENYNKEGTFPFPLVSNAALDVFKAYRAYDDFEQMVLHGTFLVDGKGLVRWQDISYEPFMDPDFLLREASRLLSQQPPGTTALKSSADNNRTK